MSEMSIEPLGFCPLKPSPRRGAPNGDGMAVEGVKERAVDAFRGSFLFSKYGEGVQLDDEMIYSVTPEPVAKQVAQLASVKGLMLDAFTGAGGNLIPLTSTCGLVVGIDIEPSRVAMTRANYSVYQGAEEEEEEKGGRGGLSPELLVGDFLQMARMGFWRKGEFDGVFLSPPWGGPSYSQKETVGLEDFQVDGRDVLQCAFGLSANVAFYLPRNLSSREFGWMGEEARRRGSSGPCAKLHFNRLVTKGCNMGVMRRQKKAQEGEDIPIDALLPGPQSSKALTPSPSWQWRVLAVTCLFGNFNASSRRGTGTGPSGKGPGVQKEGKKKDTLSSAVRGCLENLAGNLLQLLALEAEWDEKQKGRGRLMLSSATSLWGSQGGSGDGRSGKKKKNKKDQEETGECEQRTTVGQSLLGNLQVHQLVSGCLERVLESVLEMKRDGGGTGEDVSRLPSPSGVRAIDGVSLPLNGKEEEEEESTGMEETEIDESLWGAHGERKSGLSGRKEGASVLALTTRKKEKRGATEEYIASSINKASRRTSQKDVRKETEGTSQKKQLRWERTLQDEEKARKRKRGFLSEDTHAEMGEVLERRDEGERGRKRGIEAQSLKVEGTREKKRRKKENGEANPESLRRKGKLKEPDEEKEKKEERMRRKERKRERDKEVGAEEDRKRPRKEVNENHSGTKPEEDDLRPKKGKKLPRETVTGTDMKSLRKTNSQTDQRQQMPLKPAARSFLRDLFAVEMNPQVVSESSKKRAVDQKKRGKHEKTPFVRKEKAAENP
uniref:Trimethylguanosine synthase n=1 Tax=Chromera velia CCMP2878 TaxID=1169474 RepID=A0A0G4FJX3_9ALVE|eukprot:Cvel_17355.t1-p1 / transcript=Cvel_17355.t1 / gene=Cvel_17355 / organism=Chromera_velia_CCMP2878 / gene_product=Trimethylguanosine synthase, putative / transcript_product=Trimethylguanosine synthase, putative / location=Cvel_scaffold1379:9422-12174(+) / protein_length=776 / sequence_SO=supercontig / SO=protein_coding / is_pseudo=false